MILYVEYVLLVYIKAYAIDYIIVFSSYPKKEKILHSISKEKQPVYIFVFSFSFSNKLLRNHLLLMSVLYKALHAVWLPPKFIKTAIFKDHSCPQTQLSFLKNYYLISHCNFITSIIFHWYSVSIFWFSSYFSYHSLNVPFLIYKFPKELFLSFFSEFFISDVTKENYHLSGTDSLYFLGNMTYFLSPLHLQPPLQYIYFWTSYQHMKLYISN